MEAKHTPGPWGCESAMSSDLDSIRYITNPDGKSIARVRIRNFQSQDEALANARLIAAAPDLLAALQGIMAGIAGCERDAHYEAARAAIAKALPLNAKLTGEAGGDV